MRFFTAHIDSHGSVVIVTLNSTDMSRQDMFICKNSAEGWHVVESSAPRSGYGDSLCEEVCFQVKKHVERGLLVVGF